MTVKVALVVPALPSVTVTSLIEMVGGASSSVMVPTPWPSAIVALVGLRQVDEEGLVDLVEQVAVDLHRDGLRGHAGGEGHDRRRHGGIVGRRHGGAVGGGGGRPMTVWPLAAHRLTVKIALTVPALPSVTVTSLIEMVGASSSSVMVPMPWPSRIVALVGLRQVHEEGLVDLVEQVALDRDGDGLRGHAGGEVPTVAATAV